MFPRSGRWRTTISSCSSIFRMTYQKISTLHLNQIGDLLFSLPLLKSIRDHCTDASIHCVVRPALEGLLRDSPFVDRILLRHGTLPSTCELIKKLRGQHYDLLISLARSQECLLLAGLSGAGVRAGFARFPWDRGLTVKEVIQGHNSWYNNAHLLRRLDIPITQNSYVGLLCVNDPAVRAGLPEHYAVISPGASRRRLAKAWDELKFGELIARLAGEYGLTCVLVGGQDTRGCTGAIASFAEGFRKGGQEQLKDLAGTIDLRELCGVLKGAEIFVGIDSGVMHMASALDIPVVGLFGPTDPFYTGPQNAHSIVVREDLSCSPCYLRESCTHRRCMTELGVDKVLDACRKLLNR
jgi:ADP-heptose:LPS heptosyltransferase